MSAIALKELLDGLGELEFHPVARVGASHVGVFRASGGTSPWERHPHDDEVLLVLEGAVDITWLTDDDEVTSRVQVGSAIVVPRGCWHRHYSDAPWKELYMSPEVTEHSTAEDPRTSPGS